MAVNAQWYPAGLRWVGWCSAWLGLYFVNMLGTLAWAQVSFPNLDLAETVYQVRRLQLGYVPYRDTFTHHFIGYIFPFFVLGSVMPLTPSVLKVAGLCFNFMTAVLVFLVIAELTHSSIKWLGASLSVTVGWFWYWQGFAFNVQSYLVPVLTLLLLLLLVRACTRISGRAYLSGAFVAGMLLTFDQRTAPFPALLIVPPLFVANLRSMPLLWRAAGLLAVAPGLGAVYLLINGALGDFVEQTVTFPMFYRNYGITTSGTPFVFTWLKFWLFSEPIPIAVAAIGIVVVFVRDTRWWLRALFLVTLICDTIYAVAGGRLYDNYSLVFSPVVLILMSLLPWYLGKRWTAAGHVATAGLACLGLGFALTAYAASKQRPFSKATDVTIDAAAAYLSETTEQQDVVLVWGFAPQIYVLSDRFRTFRDAGLLSVTGGNFQSIVATEQGRLPHMVHEFERFLIDTPPKVIVFYELTREASGACYGKGVIQRNLDFRQAAHLKALRVLLEHSYREVKSVEGPCDRAEIFLRLNAG